MHDWIQSSNAVVAHLVPVIFTWPNNTFQLHLLYTTLQQPYNQQCFPVRKTFPSPTQWNVKTPPKLQHKNFYNHNITTQIICKIIHTNEYKAEVIILIKIPILNKCYTQIVSLPQDFFIISICIFKIFSPWITHLSLYHVSLWSLPGTWQVVTKLYWQMVINSFIIILYYRDVYKRQTIHCPLLTWTQNTHHTHPPISPRNLWNI